MANSDARLLDLLQANGDAFLRCFRTSTFPSPDSDGLSDIRPRKKQRLVEAITYEEEWAGIGKEHWQESSPTLEAEINYNLGQTNDGYTAKNPLVIFSEEIRTKSDQDVVSKAQLKAFMSSKVTKITATRPSCSSVMKSAKDEEEDRTNAENDALLHKLVHTKLLSGSLDRDLEMTAAQRRKALAGRVLELTGEVKLGKGEESVRKTEKNSAAKHVREGMERKRKERGTQELEKAKNLGNYHPTLKRLFGASSARKRERGMKMGVGKFNHGFLRLSKDDIGMAVGGHSSRPPTRSHGRGGIKMPDRSK